MEARVRTVRYCSFCLFVLVLISSVFLIGCEESDDPVSPDDQTPTPGDTPTPFLTPTPAPTPDNVMWGYVNGTALVEVSGLGQNPVNDKESIFHLYHPTTRAWMNVRHREGDRFQVKGALDGDYGCHDEVHYNDIQPAGNGIWELQWEQLGNTTRVVVRSPNGGVSEVNFVGGVAAWREIRHGSGDARLPIHSPASINIVRMTGTIGEAAHCQY
jgi:hypothetical protein